MCGRAGVGKAEESRRRPLLVSPDPATGPGAMMDAQGASRAGRRRRYAEEVGVGTRHTHLLHGRLEVEVTGLFEVQPDHGHARHGLHGGQRPPATRPLPSCSSCWLSRVSRPAPPSRKAVVLRDEKCPHGLLGGAVPTPPAPSFRTCAVQSPPRGGGGVEGESPTRGERVSGSSSLPLLNYEARCERVSSSQAKHACWAWHRGTALLSKGRA